MAEIRIDADKAERMISQILHKKKGLLPSVAKAVAANICRRLLAAMQLPTEKSVNYRIIPRFPPQGSNFNNAVAKKLAEAKDDLWNAEEIWRLVYDLGRDLPQH